MMKKIILSLVFVFTMGTMVNANNKFMPSDIGTCYDKAGAYVQSLDWDGLGEDAALEVYDLLLDLCDISYQ